MNSPAGVLLMRYLQNREEDRARQILIEDENLLNINVNLQDKVFIHLVINHSTISVVVHCSIMPASMVLMK